MTLPDLPGVANHIWQSTVFAGAAALLTLALRKNSARVRHGVWLAASCKFLIPISVLVALGGQVRWRTAPVFAQSAVAVAVDEVSQPFTTSAAIVPIAPQPTRDLLPTALSVVWLFGFVGIACSWVVRWRRIRTVVRAGLTMRTNVPIRVVSSAAAFEPGVFGVFRPVLLLPDGIADRLTATQLTAVVEHELCHVRHRDNLSAGIQMFAETVFWFHPLVWWIGKRMVEERERACDEEVLRGLGHPRAYADAILNICKAYMKSPLVCVSGVAGGNLRKRIEEIMANRIAVKLNAGRQLLLAGAGVLAVIAPITIGVLNAPPIRAQAQPANGLAFEAASVKPFATTDRASLKLPTALPGGRFVSTFPIYVVIAFAYKLPVNPSPRVAGVPDWVRASAFDIEATGTMPAGLSDQAREDRVRMMVQTLLADRFKLAIHKEAREMPVYALVVGKGGPKLQKADIEEKDCPDASTASLPPPGPSTPDADTCHRFNGGQGRGLHGRAVNMEDLASYVENWAGRPLLDKTGIRGLFHIQTRPWQPMGASAPPPPGAKADDGSDLADVPTLFQIFEQLGLKMEARNDRADVYVVDHIEKPSEN